MVLNSIARLVKLLLNLGILILRGIMNDSCIFESGFRTHVCQKNGISSKVGLIKILHPHKINNANIKFNWHTNQEQFINQAVFRKGQEVGLIQEVQ
jgi:hypothetical protein